jgi:hypothetical protein
MQLICMQYICIYGLGGVRGTSKERRISKNYKLHQISSSHSIIMHICCTLHIREGCVCKYPACLCFLYVASDGTVTTVTFTKGR